jgi:hypothetical protein
MTARDQAASICRLFSGRHIRRPVQVTFKGEGNAITNRKRAEGQTCWFHLVVATAGGDCASTSLTDTILIFQSAELSERIVGVSNRIDCKGPEPDNT